MALREGSPREERPLAKQARNFPARLPREATVLKPGTPAREEAVEPWRTQHGSSVSSPRQRRPATFVAPGTGSDARAARCGGRSTSLRQIKTHFKKGSDPSTLAGMDSGRTGLSLGLILCTVAHAAAGEPALRKGEVPSFDLDVQPILTRAGCNSGPCHGKARGQNGFQLSLLGFDGDQDHRVLTRDLAGRRIDLEDPGRSLILLKGSATMPHGGGRRLEAGSRDWTTLLRWIELGAPRRGVSEPTLAGIEVEPFQRSLAPGESFPLRVTARFSDGTFEDVTTHAAYLSSESAVAAVQPDGAVRAGPIPGEAAIAARYLGHVATCRILIPLPGTVPEGLYESLPRSNFVDELVWKKLRQLGIVPSAPAPETTVLRRIFLDLIGRLPAPAEVRAYLADRRPDRRARWVDELLERPEYADHWAGKWVDLLRPNPYRVGIKAVFNFDAWIRAAFRKNLPYDEFVRSIVTAQGSTFEPGAAVFFRDRRSPDEVAPVVSQLFLGIRLECAKCHHHPFESYAQDDFFSLAAYFARVGYKGTGLSPPISGGEEIVYCAPSGTVRHPTKGYELPPRPLFGKAPQAAEGQDPREVLFAWMSGPENPYFARVQVNRVWADLMGVGLVEPVDDLRATNPASNDELLGALAADFRTHGHDLKHLLRTIVSSSVYALASAPNERNTADTRNYSRHYRQRLRAEVLVDAVSDITGIEEQYAGMPPGSSARQIWTHRTESLSLDAFGRPDPNQDPPCQRTLDTSLVQALHLMNSTSFHAKVTHDRGRAAQLALGPLAPEALVEEIYLLVYSRPPREDEKAHALRRFAAAGASRRQICEDLLWALLNTPEFVFKD